MKNTSFLTGGLVAILLMSSGSGVAYAQALNGNRPDESKGPMGIQNFGRLMVTRLGAALDRVETLRARVSERANGIPSPKFDLALVNQSLAEAATAIVTGRQELVTIQEAIAKTSSVKTADKNKNLKEFRALIRQAMLNARTAHQKTVEAIRIIRNGYLPLLPITPPPTPEPMPVQ